MTKRFEVAVGAKNLFNEYPNKIPQAAQYAGADLRPHDVCNRYGRRLLLPPREVPVLVFPFYKVSFDLVFGGMDTRQVGRSTES